MADFDVPSWDMDEKSEAMVDNIFSNMAILSAKKDKMSTAENDGVKTKSKKRKRTKAKASAKPNNSKQTTEIGRSTTKSDKQNRKKTEIGAKLNNSVANLAVCTEATISTVFAGESVERMMIETEISTKKRKTKKANNKKNKYAHLGRKSNAEKLSATYPSAVNNFKDGEEIEVHAVADKSKSGKNDSQKFPMKSGSKIADASMKTCGKKRKVYDIETEKESISNFSCGETDNEGKTVKKRKMSDPNETSPKFTKNNFMQRGGLRKERKISDGSGEVQTAAHEEISSVRMQQASNAGDDLHKSASKIESLKKIQSLQCKDGSQKPEKKRKVNKKNRKNVGSEVVHEAKSVSVEISPRKKGFPQKLPFNINRLRAALAAARSPSARIEVEQSKRSDKNATGTSDDVGENKKKIHFQRKDAEPSLRESMMARLVAARFRLINEELYTSVSKDAVELFKTDREAFKIYHEGYQSQVAKWPTVPVDRMVQYIKSQSSDLVVADFGCGDAKIAQSVANKVYSFDLVALNKHVTVCDMKHVPLGKVSVDIAVFCLSLMGTNLVEFLCEANRVLKLGGILLIAEVVSRFRKISVFVKKLQKLGFALAKKDLSNTMFVWFEFKKTGQPPNTGKLPSIELDPCVYKKR